MRVCKVHSRDIIEHLAKSGCSDAASFEWLKELRFYWDRDIDDCIARQTNTQFQYGYEYLGNSGRLVITPLTDRCAPPATRAFLSSGPGEPGPTAPKPQGPQKIPCVIFLSREISVTARNCVIFTGYN